MEWHLRFSNTAPTVAGLVRGRLLQLYSSHYCLCTDESVAEGITSMDRDVSDPWVDREFFRSWGGVLVSVVGHRSQDASGIQRHQLQCRHERLRKGWSMGIEPPAFRWCCWLLPDHTKTSISVILLIPESCTCGNEMKWRLSNLYLRVDRVLIIPCGYTNSLELLFAKPSLFESSCKRFILPSRKRTEYWKPTKFLSTFSCNMTSCHGPMLPSGGVITLEEWDGYRTWNRKRLNKSQPSTVKSLVTSIMFHCSPMLTPPLSKIIWERLFNRVDEPLRFLGDNHSEIFRSNLVFGLEWEHLWPTRKYLWSCSGCMCSCCEVADGHTVTSSMSQLGRHH